MKKKTIILGIVLVLCVTLLREAGVLTLNWYNSSSVTYSQPPRWDHVKEAGDIGVVTIYRGSPEDHEKGNAEEIERFTVSTDGHPLEIFIADDTYVSDTTLWLPLVKRGEQKLYIHSDARFKGRTYGMGIQNWIQETKVNGICSHRHLKDQLYSQAFEAFKKELADES